MGHDIYGYNEARAEIAYARFCKDNYNANILYSLLDANHYNAGVSGSGNSASYSIKQIEKALKGYNQKYDSDDSNSACELLAWDLKQILIFLQNCLATALKEGAVRVVFC